MTEAYAARSCKSEFLLTAPGLARLKELVDLAEHRPRRTAGKSFPIDGSDGEHFLCRRRQPHFIRRESLVPGNWANLQRQSAAARQLERRVIGNTRQDLVVLGRSEDDPVAHDEHVRRRSLGQKAIAKKYRLGRAGVGGRLARKK